MVKVSVGNSGAMVRPSRVPRMRAIPCNPRSGLEWMWALKAG
jgi:hypothetical protein